jgi:hypothetical protein
MHQSGYILAVKSSLTHVRLPVALAAPVLCMQAFLSLILLPAGPSREVEGALSVPRKDQTKSWPARRREPEAQEVVKIWLAEKVRHAVTHRFSEQQF